MTRWQWHCCAMRPDPLIERQRPEAGHPDPVDGSGSIVAAWAKAPGHSWRLSWNAGWHRQLAVRTRRTYGTHREPLRR